MKANTATLCAIMRNEGPYVLEWVAYHRALGFDRIVIYDNDSTDDLPAFCCSLEQAGIISYVRWPDPPPGTAESRQVLAYRHAAATAETDWLCCLDADEFLVLDRAWTIQKFLAKAGRARMPIALNWKTFGSAGHLKASPLPVTERFTRRGPVSHGIHRHIKTIGPVSALRAGAQVHIHGWVLSDGQFYVTATGREVSIDRHTWVNPPCWEGAWVNHYVVKSQEEFWRKRSKGSASKLDKFANYFQDYDVNDEEDRTIWRFMGRSRKERAILAGLLHPQATRKRDAPADAALQQAGPADLSAKPRDDPPGGPR